MPTATISPAGIVVSQGVFPILVGPIPRSLYLYENDGVQNVVAGVGTNERALYLYENDAIYDRTAGVGSNERALYLYENDAIQALSVLLRDLYTYESPKDLPVTPLLLFLDPAQQYPLGTVDVYGDGLGQFAEVAGPSTITASSTNGTKIPANVVAWTGGTTYWQSNDGAGAWIRFTFGTPQTIYAIALEDIQSQYSAGNAWGVPLFRFSDGGADVVGGSAVPVPSTFTEDSQYPVGYSRTLYVLPAERTGITWMEVRVSSGGAGSNRGLLSARIYADQGQLAETSDPILNALSMGVVGTWLNRSPNLWPANSGVPLAKAITVVVPALGTSGLVKVTEA